MRGHAGSASAGADRLRLAIAGNELAVRGHRLGRALQHAPDARDHLPDLVRPEHAVEMFRLRGGGVFGDMPPGLPASQLAVLPGTSHVSIKSRADLLVPIVTSFLDAPMPESG